MLLAFRTGLRYVGAVLMSVVLLACGSGPDIGATASAVLHSPEGETLGTVSFTQGPEGVLVAADVEGLAPGGHAINIHAVGVCTPDFTAAGDHFDPSENYSGFVHPNWKRGDTAGAHGGDLPNLYAASDGTARADFYTEGVTLASGEDHSLFDDDGSSVVINEKPDTYGEDDHANTGARVACGVIRRS